MLFGWIVRKYSADLILLTKFKELIGVKEKFAQNMEVPVSLMKFLLQTLGSFGGFFCLTFYILRWLLGEQDFRSSLVWFLGDKIRNSNEFQRMYFQFALIQFLLSCKALKILTSPAGTQEALIIPILWTSLTIIY